MRRDEANQLLDRQLNTLIMDGTRMSNDTYYRIVASVDICPQTLHPKTTEELRSENSSENLELKAPEVGVIV